MAQVAEVPYYHANLVRKGRKELTGEQFLSEHTDGLGHFGGIVSYVWYSALSKALLFLDLPKGVLRGYGIHNRVDKAKSLLLIADAVSISRGEIVEKPQNEKEMIAQLETILPSCAPYYMVIASLAMWRWSKRDGALWIWCR
jgi:hypothetical protein